MLKYFVIKKKTIYIATIFLLTAGETGEATVKTFLFFFETRTKVNVCGGAVFFL